jgi:hypothetical protein
MAGLPLTRCACVSFRSFKGILRVTDMLCAGVAGTPQGSTPAFCRMPSDLILGTCRGSDLTLSLLRHPLCCPNGPDLMDYRRGP